jgi:Ran GTPase-activating protein (RanGAP) involved in mRNA processing and transport
LWTLDVSNLELGDDNSGEMLMDALKGNGIVTRLNLSNNYLSSAFCMKLTNAIPTMGALTEVNISNNNLAGTKAGKALADMLKANSVLTDLDASNNYNRDTRGANDGPGFARELADGVRANRVLVKFTISDNNLRAEGGKALAKALKNNTIMKELNIAKNYLGYDANGCDDMSGVIAISNAIPTMGALKKLLMAKNRIRGAKAGKALGKMLAANTVLKELDLSDQGNGFKPNNLDAACAKKLAIGLGANGTLVKFDISQNSLCAEGTKLVAQALKDNQTMTELNISNNNLGELVVPDGWKHWPGNEEGKKFKHTDGTYRGTAPDGTTSGAEILADAIKNNGALAKLTFGGNSYKVEDGYDYYLYGEGYETKYKTVTPEAAVLEVGMAEANLSDKNLGVGGAIIVGAWISHKDNGAMTSLNISKNKMLTKEAGKALADAIAANSVLKELDVSDNKWSRYGDGKAPWMGDGPGFAKELADGIKNNGALTSLNISSNQLTRGSLKQDRRKRDYYRKITERDTSTWGSKDHHYNTDMSGVIAISDAISTMGAMTSLNISSNNIGQMVPPEVMPDGWVFRDVANPDRRFCYQGKYYSSSCPGAKPAGVIALVDAIKNNGALTSLNIRNNGPRTAEIEKAINQALRVNRTKVTRRATPKPKPKPKSKSKPKPKPKQPEVNASIFMSDSEDEDGRIFRRLRKKADKKTKKRPRSGEPRLPHPPSNPLL